MACPFCEKEKYKDGLKFLGYKEVDTRGVLKKCPRCKQVWWCYNKHYGLWTTVDDEATIKNIKQGCPQPVSIGRPAQMLPGKGWR